MAQITAELKAVWQMMGSYDALVSDIGVARIRPSVRSTVFFGVRAVVSLRARAWGG